MNCPSAGNRYRGCSGKYGNGSNFNAFADYFVAPTGGSYSKAAGPGRRPIPSIWVVYGRSPTNGMVKAQRVTRRAWWA
jgi:hypothetical protein